MEPEQEAVILGRAVRKIRDKGTVSVLTNEELAVMLNRLASNVEYKVARLGREGPLDPEDNHYLTDPGFDALLWREAAKRLLA